MSVHYQAVNWNRQKRLYDGLLLLGIGLTIGTFAVVTAIVHPAATIETMLIRGLGFTAFLLLTLILAIGPLARLDRRFLPLLYNRRHLGVALGGLGLAHAGFVLFQFHALGNVSPLVSLFSANREVTSLTNFPFEWFGVAALVILGLMAATSHDFWLSVLTPPVWKRLHLLVYLAYLLLLLHVGLGFLQDERDSLYLIAIGAGAVLVALLHVAAGLREARLDRLPAAEPEWVDLGPAATIPEGLARIGLVAGERVAVFRHEGRLNAVSNVCRHQNGPLGEGRIVDGCITCPWHGYQYRPEDGRSPPPFDDRLPTFDLRIRAGRVEVFHAPHAPGTWVEPVPITPAVASAAAPGVGGGPAPLAGAAAAAAVPDPPMSAREAFYVGYQPQAAPALGRWNRYLAVTVLGLAAGAAGLFALAQSQFDAAAFDFGHPTSLEGTIRAAPYPMLEVADPGSGRVSRYLLAGAGKHGAAPLVAPLVNRPARLTGTLAHRDGLRVLEVAEAVEAARGAPAGTPAPPVGDSVAAGAAPRIPAPVDFGVVSLEGEFADSKCYAGVMNPGRGKTHRGCAARCLAGGITPLFVARNPDGVLYELIVVGPRMTPLPWLADRAGRQVRVTGRLWRDRDLWFLELPGSIAGPADLAVASPPGGAAPLMPGAGHLAGHHR